MRTYKRNTSPVTVIEQIYNVCCLCHDGSVRIIKENANTNECNRVFKKFKRIADGKSSIVSNIKKIYLQPIKEVRITEK